jgi:hypothetical protein
MNLSLEQKAEIFDAIYLEYVKRHGLGGMSKADLDALIVYLLVTKGPEINAFDLSNEFKITESRIKSLLESAAVKFDQRTLEKAWSDLLKVFERVEFDVESLEKGQMRFQLSDPMLFRWLQDRVRSLGSTCSYGKSSEQVTMNLETLYQVLSYLWQDKKISENWTGDFLLSVQERIQVIIGRIGQTIKNNSLEDLKKRKQPKLLKALQTAATYIGIGLEVAKFLREVGLPVKN